MKQTSHYALMTNCDHLYLYKVNQDLGFEGQ